MRVRYMALVGLAICLSAMFVVSAHAQQFEYRNADSSTLKVCDAKYMPTLQSERYKKWTQAGVARLLPEILGGGKEMVHLFFAVDLTPEYLSPEEMTIVTGMTLDARRNLEIGRLAVKEVIARYLYTPKGTLESEAPKESPQYLLGELSDAMRPENLERVVVTCGTIMKGMSFGTRSSDGVRYHTTTDTNPWVAMWYQDGVEKDGVPGFWVWQSKKMVGITSGPYQNQVVKIKLVEWCGNVYFDLAPLEFTENVTAPLNTTPTTGIVIPPPAKLPQLRPPPPAKVQPQKKEAPKPAGSAWFPCVTGKGNKVVCGLIGVGALAAFWPGGQADAPGKPPNQTKNGNNGGR